MPIWISLRAISSVSTYSAMVCKPSALPILWIDSERVIEVILRHPLHEEAVDLDAVHGEVLEVVERRKPAAEVVEEEAHAERPQRLDQRARALHVGDRRRLGDLQQQARRWHAVLRELVL